MWPALLIGPGGSDLPFQRSGSTTDCHSDCSALPYGKPASACALKLDASYLSFSFWLIKVLHVSSGNVLDGKDRDLIWAGSPDEADAGGCLGEGGCDAGPNAASPACSAASALPLGLAGSESICLCPLPPAAAAEAAEAAAKGLACRPSREALEAGAGGALLVSLVSETMGGPSCETGAASDMAPL